MLGKGANAEGPFRKVGEVPSLKRAAPRRPSSEQRGDARCEDRFVVAHGLAAARIVRSKTLHKLRVPSLPGP